MFPIQKLFERTHSQLTARKAFCAVSVCRCVGVQPKQIRPRLRFVQKHIQEAIRVAKLLVACSSAIFLLHNDSESRASPLYRESLHEFGFVRTFLFSLVVHERNEEKLFAPLCVCAFPSSLLSVSTLELHYAMLSIFTQHKGHCHRLKSLASSQKPILDLASLIKSAVGNFQPRSQPAQQIQHLLIKYELQSVENVNKALKYHELSLPLG